MSQKIYLSLNPKDDDPLGEHPLRALLSFDVLLPQTLDGGHLVLNLYEGEEFLGTLHLVWDTVLEHGDPHAGRYLLASGHIDDINLVKDIPDAELRRIAVSTMKRSNISVEENIRGLDDIRQFIIALQRNS